MRLVWPIMTYEKFHHMFSCSSKVQNVGRHKKFDRYLDWILVVVYYQCLLFFVAYGPALKFNLHKTAVWKALNILNFLGWIGQKLADFYIFHVTVMKITHESSISAFSVAHASYSAQNRLTRLSQPDYDVLNAKFAAAFMFKLQDSHRLSYFIVNSRFLFS